MACWRCATVAALAARDGARTGAARPRATAHRAPRAPASWLRNALNGLNLYRANFLDKLLHPQARRAHAPVQFIVPLRDRYVGPELSLGQEIWLGPYERIEIDAGHWAVLREPELIAAHIARFVAGHLDGPGGSTGPTGSATPPLNARAAGG